MTSGGSTARVFVAGSKLTLLGGVLVCFQQSGKTFNDRSS